MGATVSVYDPDDEFFSAVVITEYSISELYGSLEVFVDRIFPSVFLYVAPPA